jgi:cob(I)alamin adenosyltransferase
MSISTKVGDTGMTSLFGGTRVSKTDLRVEAYGTIDELNSALGIARSQCADETVCELVKRIQRELFAVGSCLATPPGSKNRPPEVTPEMVAHLTQQVHRIEAIEGILGDWSIPGEHRAAAAFDLARTVCRRAERASARVMESGEEITPLVLAYLNRLSDLLWLFGRLLEVNEGVDSALRPKTTSGTARPSAW